MSQLPFNQAVPRFKANEARVDIFVNGTYDQTWYTSDGTPLPTIQGLLRTIDDSLPSADFWESLGGELDNVRALADEYYGIHEAAIAQIEASLADLREEAIAAYGPIFEDRPSLYDRIESLFPEQRSIQDRLTTVSDQLLWATEFIGRTDKHLLDAGLTVDPETGTAKLEAVARLDNEISQVGIELDAVNASLELKASYADVDYRISQAQLPEGQLPILDDFYTRVSQLEIDLNAAEGAIALKADTTEIEGISTTLSQVQVDLDSLDSRIELKAERSVVDGINDQLSTALVTIDALDGASITQTVQDVRRQYEEIDLTAITNFEQLWENFAQREEIREGMAAAQSQIYANVNDKFEAEAGQRLALAVKVDNNIAALLEEQRVLTTTTKSLAESITELEAELQGELTGNANALASLTSSVEQQGETITAQSQDIVELRASLSDANDEIQGNADAFSGLSATVTNQNGQISSLSSSLTLLQTSVGNNASSIQSLSASKVDSEGAIAAVEDRISASFGNLQALAESSLFAEATANGIISGQILRLNGQNVFEVVSVDGGNTVTAEFDTDYIRIRNLAQFDTVLLDKLFAADIVTERLEITDGMVVAGRYLQKERIAEQIGDMTVTSQTTIVSIRMNRDPERHAVINFGFSVKSKSNDTVNVNWKLFADVSGDGQNTLAQGNLTARRSNASGRDWVGDSTFDPRSYDDKDVVLTLVIEATNGEAVCRNGILKTLQTGRKI